MLFNSWLSVSANQFEVDLIKKEEIRLIIFVLIPGTVSRKLDFTKIICVTGAPLI